MAHATMRKLRIPSLPHQPCVLCCHLGQRVKLDVQQHSLANGLLGDKCDHRRQRRERSERDLLGRPLKRTACGSKLHGVHCGNQYRFQDMVERVDRHAPQVLLPLSSQCSLCWNGWRDFMPSAPKKSFPRQPSLVSESVSPGVFREQTYSSVFFLRTFTPFFFGGAFNF